VAREEENKKELLFGHPAITGVNILSIKQHSLRQVFPSKSQVNRVVNREYFLYLATQQCTVKRVKVGSRKKPLNCGQSNSVSLLSRT